MSANPDLLTANFTMEYAFKRSLGPVLSAFFTALSDGRVLGIRASDGRVLMPPSEYDPSTGEELRELVPLADTGVITSFTWVSEPRRSHPLREPFAFALIQLDGSHTPFLHVVAARREQLRAGLRVTARWAEERQGAITDIACFVPLSVSLEAP